MKSLLVSTACALWLLSLVTVPSGNTAQTTDDYSKEDPHKKIFETKCQQCHSLEKIKAAHLTKEKAKETVERMSKKQGANISKDEAEKIYDYLGTYYFIAPAPLAVPSPMR